MTTDHGRERGFRSHGREYPESARVWLAATENAIDVRQVGSLERDLYLEDIVPTVRFVAGLPESPTLGGHVIAELFEPGATGPVPRPARRGRNADPAFDARVRRDVNRNRARRSTRSTSAYPVRRLLPES